MAYGVKGHRTVTIHQGKVHIEQDTIKHVALGHQLQQNVFPRAAFRSRIDIQACSAVKEQRGQLVLGISLICFQDGAICVCCNCLLHPFDVEGNCKFDHFEAQKLLTSSKILCDPVEIQTSFLSLGVDLSPKLMTVTPEHSMTKNLRH